VTSKQVPTPASARLACNIKAARDAAGMTQAQLASALGLGEAQTVSNWERGLFKPSEDNLAGLCQVTGRDLAWFYTDHDAEPTGAAA
jgi:transcriptional regulator with XRE-family HTH domain